MTLLHHSRAKADDIVTYSSHRIHVVLKTNPSISFFSCPKCSQNRRDEPPECLPPPKGTCVPLDTSLDSVFEV